MAVTVLHIDLLMSDPDIHDGQPIITDTRLRVLDIVHLYDPKDKQSAEKLATLLGISIAQVYAAMAYYHLNKAKFAEQTPAE